MGRRYFFSSVAVLLLCLGTSNLQAADTIDSLKATTSKKNPLTAKEQLPDSLKISAPDKNKKQTSDSLPLSVKKSLQKNASLKLSQKTITKADTSNKTTAKKVKQTNDSSQSINKAKTPADDLSDSTTKDKKTIDTSVKAIDNNQLENSIKAVTEIQTGDLHEPEVKNEQQSVDLRKTVQKNQPQSPDSLKNIQKRKNKLKADLLQHLKDYDCLSCPPPLLHCTIPATTEGKLMYSIAGSILYASDASLVTGRYGKYKINSLDSGGTIDPGVSKIFNEEFTLRFGINKKFDLSVKVPYYIDWTGWGPKRGTWGDLTLAGTFVPSSVGKPIRFGVQLGLTLPTGSQEKCFFPRHVYYIHDAGSNLYSPYNDSNRVAVFVGNKVYVHPLFITSIDIMRFGGRIPLELHVNIGSTISNAKDRFTLDGGLALVVHPVKPLALSAELTSEVRPFVSDRTFTDALAADPLYFVPAIAVDLPAGISLRFATEIGLSSERGTVRSNWLHNGYVYGTKATPSFNMSFSFIMHGDSRSFFSRRKNSSWRGDKDQDSIPDTLDTCPEAPEDRDGFSDKDGCPDYDNDSDGIIDEVDRCPNDPEDKDGFEDKDGCPDPDNDRDSVTDVNDACPDEKGTENNRGCPETGDLYFFRTVLSSVVFEPESAHMISGTAMLDSIFIAMEKTPSTVIEFQVHTDNSGSSEGSLELSQKRADVLKQYLVDKGIRSDRITAVGFGSEFPIADNSTKEGRAKNQRVEVRRIE